MDKEIFLYVGGNQEVPKDVKRVRIDPSVKIINGEAFRDCQALREVEFCEGLEEVGEQAFYKCTSLEYIRTPSTTRVIGNTAFYCCSSLKNVSFNEGLEDIGNQAFYHCKSLESIRAPSTTRVIGKLAFYCCTSLKNVLFNEGLVEIKDMAFSSCSRLTNVCLPSTMKWLRNAAFSHCTQLRIVALNEGLEKVEGDVFVGCKMLQLVGIPLSVGHVDEDFGASGIRTEVERSDELWEKVHKHVVETVNAVDGMVAATGASEVGDDFETISGSSNEDKLKAEIEVLRNQVEEAATEKNILTQELAGMKRKFQENLSDLERIAKKLDNLEEEKDEE